MSCAPILQIPQLKEGIIVRPYDDPAEGGEPRYLVSVSDHYFLVSAKATALMLALIARPGTHEDLEAAYSTRSGHHMPAEQLIALAGSVLPEVLLHDTSLLERQTPFIFNIRLLHARQAAQLGSYLGWLFKPKVAFFLLALFLVLHVAVLPSAMGVPYGGWSSGQLVALAALFLLSGFIHELGHTAACRYFACPHGGIGVGLYHIFPAWYADVSSAWQLPRRQRVVVDLGGVYFQAILLIAVDAFALATGSLLALKLVWLITFAMLFTLNPVFKFDGYWLLSDLSGLHNLHKQVRQSVSGLIAKAMGGRCVPMTGLRAAFLYAYLAMSACYLLYFATFLAKELYSFRALATQFALPWQALAAGGVSHGWYIAHAVAQGLSLMLWPLVIALASLFFIRRLHSGLTLIHADVRRTLAVSVPSKLP